VISLPGEISGTRCSRAGCRAEATWAVNWRNPRIHGPERVKVWLACDEHRDFLHESPTAHREAETAKAHRG